MAYFQKNIPKPIEESHFNLKNFAGGLNNRSELLQDNEASEMWNMKFTNDTVMEKRKGLKKHTETTAPRAITFLSEYLPYKDDPQFIMGTDTNIYIDEKYAKNTNGHINGINFNGFFIFTDGTGIYAYGKFPQEENTYQRIEGTPKDEYMIMRIDSAPKEYEPLSEEHTQGVTIYDYSAERLWYEPCLLEMQDPYKGANVLPENTRYVVEHQGRVYISGSELDDDNVFISDVRNPFYFPVYMPMQLPPNSDAIKGLIVYDNAVIIARERDMYYIRGNTNNINLGGELFHLTRLNTHAGVMNNRSMCIAHNYMFFVGSDGNTYALSSANDNVRVLSTQMLNQKVDFLKAPFNLTLEDFSDVATYFFDNEWYVSVKDYVFIYNYLFRSWTVYTNWQARSFFNQKGTLLIGREDGIIASESEDSYLDMGVPYLAKYATKQFDMEDALTYKFFREFFFVVAVFPDLTSRIRVTFDVDYRKTRMATDIVSNISRYGRSKYGDRYIANDIFVSTPYMVHQRGRFIRIVYENSYDLHQTVYSVDELTTIEDIRPNETMVYVELDDQYYVYELGGWKKITIDDLNQPMRVYQINGDYQLRGRRG